MKLIRFHDVLRDGIQSLMGTNPSADEIIQSYPTAHQTNCDMIQTAGGTFFDLFAKKGRDEWNEVEKIITHFRGHGVKQSALVRGDFLFGYEPYSYDVVEGVILEFAKMGINVFHNFHGMNDHVPLIGVCEAVKRAQEKGYNVIANGTICIEDNPNITISSCLKFAKKLVDLGHQGFYLKSASGRLNPEFVYTLTSQLINRFPQQEITIHAHSTYGEAPACYISAILASLLNKKTITIDVQHPALSGSTAQPSMTKMAELISNYPDPSVNIHAPELDNQAIKDSLDSLLRLRFRYREYETAYDKELLDTMYDARVPGGASSTLKSIPGLVDNLARILELENDPNKWEKIQSEIYKQQKKILKDLGQPTQVTPYAANTTGQAAISLWNILEGRDQYSTLYPGIVNYLSGMHGMVPDSANKDLISKALDQKGLKKIVEYKSSMKRKDMLGQAELDLLDAGIEKPTLRQKLSYLLLGDIDHVLLVHREANKPLIGPDLPFFSSEPIPWEKKKISSDGKTYLLDIRDAITSIGGVPVLQEIAERILHLKQLNDGHYIFPDSYSDLGKVWFDINMRKLIQIIDSIDQKLIDNGFSNMQIKNMTSNQGQITIFECIKEVLENRGKGLFKYFDELYSESHSKNEQ
ncbi:hypothetical protein OA439_04335 [Gammaproteobacteria bacterium]|nr:hypothetical protein [Gammaproteobacteria bacterium]